jgi:oligoribonuclease NrnB/cAMP/cGMP phosphodiesterase (DHH superfamily)
MIDISKTALVTHVGCMDGAACAVLFIAAGGKRKNVYFTLPNHEHVEERLEHLFDRHEGYIVVADVSVSLEYAENEVPTYDISLLDHHKASIPLNGLDWCEVNEENSMCGSKMLFEWILGNVPNVDRGRILAYKNFLNAVDDMDRWIKAIPESQSLASLFSFLGQQLFIDRFISAPDLELTASEQYAVRIEEQKKEEFIGRMKKEVLVRVYEIDGRSVRVGFVLATTPYQSQLGHAICESLELDVEMAVIVGDKSISMRASRDAEVDLSVIAALNGGGGHVAAAGCQLSKVTGEDLLEKVANRLRFK